jgi:hypothetical protein
MIVTCVTTKTFYETARQIAGPDATIWMPDVQIDHDVLDGTELLMLFLHPSADGRALRNDAGQTVLAVEDLRAADLQDSIVFLGACYGLENTEILDTLRNAGARAVVAGSGVNAGGVGGFSGADVLATAFRASLATLPVRPAWIIARLYARLAAWRNVPGADDALEYRLITWNRETMERRLTTALIGILTLLGLLFSLFFGGMEVPKLTLFSSILPPPTAIARWEKTMDVDGTSVPMTETVELQAGQVVTITDWITPSSTTTFTLVEAWDTDVLTLTSWTTATGGSIVTGTGALTWSVTSAITVPYGLTKTWTVADAWISGDITETLTTSGGVTVTLPLTRVTPTITPTPTKTNTPTPTPTYTPRPTFTPFYTAQPWVETPYPTATPCVGFGCTTTEESILYLKYLPLILQNYSP